MGLEKDEFRIRDLLVGTKQNFKVRDNYIKNLFQSHSGTGLNNTLRLMRDFTQLTGREVAMDFFTSFNKSPAKRYQISGYTLAVPELGDQSRVYDPRLTGNEFTRGEGLDSIFFVPLFHIHTHPSFSSAVPSENDLRHSSNRKKRTYEIKGNNFFMHTPSISVITSTYGTHLFYRPTGDLEAYIRFMEYYASEESKFIRRNVRGEEDVAKMMEESGAFIAYSSDHALGGEIIPKEHIDAIAEKFQTTIEVTRVS
jgi:hypothetical protein